MTTTRGPGRIERSESGGAVRGKIPHSGGSSKTNHNTGMTVMKHGTARTKAVGKGNKTVPTKAVKKRDKNMKMTHTSEQKSLPKTAMKKTMSVKKSGAEYRSGGKLHNKRKGAK